jgi:hypothetical protein
MPGQFRIGFPPKPVGRLLLAQEDEVVELGRMVAISGSPMETLVDTDSRWTTRPSGSCVTPMIMGIPPFEMMFLPQGTTGYFKVHHQARVSNPPPRIPTTFYSLASG